jgi:hypothetical protein
MLDKGMKVLSSILGFYILFLVAVPSFEFAGVFLKKKDCSGSCSNSCSESGGEKQCPSDKQDSSCNMVCNPFMFCCNCYALLSQSHKVSAPFTYSNQKYSVSSEAIHSYFLSEAWKPPRFV